MGLDSKRSQFNPVLEKVGKYFLAFSPSTLTIVSFLLAALSGVLIAISGRYVPSYFLIFSFISLFISSLLDALDGYVARKKNVASRFGDMLDHTFDRYSDIFLITGFSFSIFSNVYIGMLSLGAVFMTSYMGTQAQALGLKRNYGGILGRADRLVIMMIVILVEILYPFSFNYFIGLDPFNVMLIFFLIAGYITSATRFRDSMKGLRNP